MSDTTALLSALNRLDADIEVQWGRVSLMQRWLEDHSTRLEHLSSRIDASLARIDVLLSRRTK